MRAWLQMVVNERIFSMSVQPAKEGITGWGKHGLALCVVESQCDRPRYLYLHGSRLACVVFGIEERCKGKPIYVPNACDGMPMESSRCSHHAVGVIFTAADVEPGVSARILLMASRILPAPLSTNIAAAFFPSAAAVSISATSSSSATSAP